MAQDDVTLRFGAAIGPLVSALERGTDATKQATATMQKSIEGIGSSLAKVQTAFLAFAAIATGGEAIKKLVSSAGDWQLETLKLSKALGLSTEQASVYQVALFRLGISSDVLLTASSKMSKQIHTNADAFARAGIALKNTHGAYRPLAEIMDDVNAKLASEHNRVQQNIDGQKFYGKGWEEVRSLLRVTAKEMEESARRTKELGLAVSGPGTEAAKTYKKSLADIDLVGKSLSLQMGNVLLPAVTQVGLAFASAAPAIGETFGNVLKFIAKRAIDVGAAFQALGTHVGGYLAAANAALHGNFAGAGEVLRQVSAEVDAIEAKANKMKAAIDAPVAPPSSSNEPDDKPSPDDTDNRLSKWAEMLAEAKASYEAQNAAAGQFREFDKEQERAFWEAKLALTVKGTNEARAVRAKIAEATSAIEKKNFDTQIAELKSQEAAFKTNGEARLGIERDIAARMKVAYGENSTQYKDAAKAIVATERQMAEDVLTIRRQMQAAQRDVALAGVAESEAVNEFEVEQGKKTKLEALAAERDFENQRFAIKRDALVKDLELEAQNPDRDLKKIAALNAQILALETEHEARIRQVRRKTVLESQKNYKQFVDGVAAGFQNVISGFLKGTMTVGQAIKGIFTAVLDSIINVIAKMAAEWVAKKLMMLAVDKSTGVATAASYAGLAGAAGVASFAAAPWPIDLGAPAFGASMFAAAMAFTPAAAKGYDIPAGVNPVTQLHEKEMVLPQGPADAIRGLAEGGRAGGNINISVKGHGIGDFFILHRAELVKALQSARSANLSLR